MADRDAYIWCDLGWGVNAHQTAYPKYFDAYPKPR
jgi:hypothetical protein